MKKITANFTNLGYSMVILAWFGIGHALGAPESEVYPSYQIHHYAVNHGASTVSVAVPSYYSFQTGHYEIVPSHTAEAPLPRDKYSAAYWIPWSNVEAGHWAR